MVLDDFLPGECCQGLLDYLTEAGHDGPEPPLDKWERAVRPPIISVISPTSSSWHYMPQNPLVCRQQMALDSPCPGG